MSVRVFQHLLRNPAALAPEHALAAHFIDSPPDATVMEPPRAQSMWAVRHNTVVLFDVARADVRNLEQHWAAYELNARVGPPCETMWGVMHHLDDFRA